MAWTLGQLRTFVAVAELGSMTRAAEHLGYSVGAVSQHITALRRVVDSDLFLRRGRGLVLAEAGRTLLPRARNILAAQKQAEMAMLGREFRSEAIVTLGVLGSASTPAMRGVSWRAVAEEDFGIVVPAGSAEPRAGQLAEADWILPPAEDLFGRAMRLATSALGITAKETHIVTDTAVALALAGTGLGLTLASPIM